MEVPADLFPSYLPNGSEMGLNIHSSLGLELALFQRFKEGQKRLKSVLVPGDSVALSWGPPPMAH